MKHWQLVAFILCVFALSVIFKQTENMSTCSRRVYGPKSDTEYPEIYGPDGQEVGKKEKETEKEKEKQGMYPDDGEFSSNTASKNEAYSEVFMYKPFMVSWDPVTAPPAPYLSDFSSFHR